MDAPTSTSADNSTSGDAGNSGVGARSGWFVPRRAPSGEGRTDSGTTGAGTTGVTAESAGRDRIAVQGRTFASIRPVGSGGTRPAPPLPRSAAGAPPAANTVPGQSPGTVDKVPDAFRPRAGGPGGEEGPSPHPQHPQVHEGQGTGVDSGGRPDPVSATEAAVRSRAARSRPGGRETIPRDPADAVRPHPEQPEPDPPSVVERAGGPVAAAASDTERSAARVPRQEVPLQQEAPPPGAAAAPDTSPPPRALRPAAPRPEVRAAPSAAPAGQQSVVPPEPPAPGAQASPDANLVRRTLAEIAPVANQVTSYFYSLLFVRHPELRNLFPVAMDTQRDRLLKALLTAADHMDSPAVLTGYLRQLGRGHRKYGTQSVHYPAVGEALLGALARYASAIWDDETEGAWVRTYTTISQIMIDAAAENEQHAPAWWQAEVVSHELRTSDIVVITVRPDQPYPFLAGQYTSLAVPWWPQVWRHYSFASAPRPDGLLSFHVKAVPAGWVSNALVHRARPGDVLRLGPPAGSMTVDHSTDNGLLCLGGGTGIAPIKALVEDVAAHGHRRRIEVFYGARSDHELYDIETMLELESVHPWLAVRPVVAEGPSPGLTGRLPEAVRERGPWHEYDAYLSGPPGMIRSSLDMLRGSGIPLERIRHDSFEELVSAAT
jgi:NAD(P)H-flavin reductase/hemoglobin-like flavoprotein